MTVIVDEPDWSPLEHAIPAEQCEEFMYMGRSGEIALYKHSLTRRYLNIHRTNGTFHRYDGDTYVEISRNEALDRVFRC